MNFTILGSGGFIGSSLATQLQARGASCFLPERNHPFSPTKNLGHVIYSIGLTSDFRRRPMDTVRAHVSELMRVLESSNYDSFLYLSSTRVYAGSAIGDEMQNLVVNPTDPSDLYNLSKLMGEAVCFSQANEKVRVARLSNVIGNDFNSDNFLFSLIKEAIASKEINFHTSLEAAKDYVAIDDVSESLIKIAETGRQRLYNVASGKNVTNQTVVNEIIRLTGSALKTHKTVEFLKIPTISIQRLREEFNYHPRDVMIDMKRLIDLYRASLSA